MADKLYDLVIVGGGINGAGIAADAAGRGLSVLLAEMGDLASGTSSASSKLIHGGLRYLEHLEFRLVREALLEREVLMAKAPHAIWPLRFVLPRIGGGRSWLTLRAGLFLYDHLGRRRHIPGSQSLDLTQDTAGQPLRPDLVSGFAYWDCWVDDARLVVLNALAAAQGGAEILTRTRVTGARTDGGLWRITMGAGSMMREVRSRALVNASGPWVSDIARAIQLPGHSRPAPKVRLVKGGHIVVSRIPGANDAYLFQSPDGRVIFALPFEEAFTLIGTTDAPFGDDPGDATASHEEERYLLGIARCYFKAPLTPSDVVWRFAGVRALDDDAASDPAAVTRDYRLELSGGGAIPALLTVIGGKITTYRRLAEAALARLAPHLPPMKPPWTKGAPLPGGNIGEGGFAAYLSSLLRLRPRFAPATLKRLTHRYGTRVEALLGDARNEAELGQALGGGLTEREVRFLAAEEWARVPDDILWRRTKAGLHMSARERAMAGERIAHMLK